MGPYLGDVIPGKVLYHMWDSYGADGASITRATNGTISVYKDNGTTQTTTGVTDTEDFDTLTGIHLIAIDTSADATFYSWDAMFHVVLSGATIDGKTVNAVLFSFSIMRDALKHGILDAGITQAASQTGATLRAAAAFGTNSPAGATFITRYSNESQARAILTSTGDAITFDAMVTAPTGTIPYVVLGSTPMASTTVVSADVTKISGDTTAADNLEAALDGTGGVTWKFTHDGNVSGSIGSLATQAKADVNAEVDSALTDAGVTVARQGYLDNLNIGENVAGVSSYMFADLRRFNGEPVIGDGSPADPIRTVNAGF